MKKVFLFGTVALLSVVAMALEVTDVSGRQRWPWNGLVDVDFTLEDVASSETWYRIDIVASYPGVAGKGVHAQTFTSQPLVRGGGTHRIVWNMWTDCPNVLTDALMLRITAAPLGDLEDVYLVIDLSGGPTAASYPSRYVFAAPDLSDDTCRTTELWLKRVPAGTFTMGTGTGSNKSLAAHAVRLTKPFFMAIFPTTQAQWAQVMGDWPSFFTNETYRAGRPVESVSWSRIRGHGAWYGDGTALNGDTFVERLRTKSALVGVDVPSEAQWEYVCRAGTTGDYYFNGTAEQVRSFARTAGWSGETTDDRNQDLKMGTAKVGSYPANPWGFYDFYGNVCQLVPDGASKNDWTGLAFGPDVVKDPVGPLRKTMESCSLVSVAARRGGRSLGRSVRPAVVGRSISTRRGRAAMSTVTETGHMAFESVSMLNEEEW